jgi:LysR family positive regulator for ilvC
MLMHTLVHTDLVLIRSRNQAEAAEDGPFVLPARGLVREAAERWFRRRGKTPTLAAEPEGNEGVLALAALGCGIGIVPRLVLEASANAGRVTELPASPPLDPFRVGLCVRRTDLRRPLIAALWALTNDNPVSVVQA